MEQDFLGYKNSEYMSNNSRLKKIIEFVGLKYNISRECVVLGEKCRRVNLRQTKKFICEKCFEYFKVEITLKQISYLLRPQKGKFPYTSIIIIETIYNLLESDKDRYNVSWNEECLNYLKKNFYGELPYEEFMLGCLPEHIKNKKEEFMNSEYRKMFNCYIDSRGIFQEIFGETSIEECIDQFPIKPLAEQQIPKTMYAYQASIRYIKV